MGIFNEFYKKEKPFFTGIARGFGFGGGGGGGAPDAPTAPFSVSGGTKITSGSYDYHVFTSDSTLEVSGVPGPARILVIAAGGSGGAGFTGNGTYGGGGGGAGGIAYGSNVTLTYGTHTVTIGQPAPNVAGGTQNSGSPPYPAAAGGHSCFGHDGSSAEFPYGIKINGGSPGGQGGKDPNNNPNGNSAAATGASTGGGGARHQHVGQGGAVTAKTTPSDWTYYANAGSPADPDGNPNASGAGGGGAGGAGNEPPGNNHAGAGGAGQAFPSFPGPLLAPAIPGNPGPFGSTVGPTGLYGGGGGGGTQTGDAGGSTNGTGGSGGGGNGGGGPPDFPFQGYSGINFTGGGAGGSTGNRPTPSTMAVGGKGLVVVRVDKA